LFGHTACRFDDNGNLALPQRLNGPAPIEALIGTGKEIRADQGLRVGSASSTGFSPSTTEPSRLNCRVR